MSRPAKRKSKPKNQINQALYYYRGEIWTPRRLRDKVGRLTIRMLAVNKVHHEKTGKEILSSSTQRILQSLVQTKPAAHSG